ERLEDLVAVLLLPAFFALTGTRTEIGLVSGAEQWMMCGLVVLLASLGKFGGSTVAARVSGLSWNEASAIGVLMNARGMMALIVPNAGLALHIPPPTVSPLMVVMPLPPPRPPAPLLPLPPAPPAELVAPAETAAR